MELLFTPAARRALAAARRWASPPPRAQVAAEALVLGLLAEEECRAAQLLAAHGIEPAIVLQEWPGLARNPSQGAVVAEWELDGEGPSPVPADRLAPELADALRAACSAFLPHAGAVTLATEELLAGLVLAPGPVSAWLQSKGLSAEVVQAAIRQSGGHADAFDPRPLEVDVGSGISDSRSEISDCDVRSEISDSESPIPAPQSPLPSWAQSPIPLLRTIDAAANRCREGLRVVEDYARFVLDARHLTGLLKELRHDLSAALAPIPLAQRLAARETEADVGTSLSTPAEQRRDTPDDVLAANFARIGEALRTLEEFGKLLDADAARRLEGIRYRAYTLQRALGITAASLRRLEGKRLYVLLDGRPDASRLAELCRSLVAAGADLLQLRDKRLGDRELLARARVLRELTAGTPTLFVMNDRPDLAVLARADGVHVGQEELPVKAVRTVVGPEMLIGVSTHSLQQARAAVLDGADYLGVGPVFPSATKAFEAFPGLELVRAVSAEIRLPAFVIGGIGMEQLDAVLAAGATRIAVSSAVLAAADPAAAVRALRERLKGARGVAGVTAHP